MPGRPAETDSQRNFVLTLRFKIDTARKYPSKRNREEAIAYARSQPLALRSTHVAHNLGTTRWEWLAAYGVTPIGEEGSIEGSFKTTSSPDLTS